MEPEKYDFVNYDYSYFENPGKKWLNQDLELLENFDENEVVEFLKSLSFVEEKEAKMEEVLTEQWEKNDILYIISDDSELTLIKDGVETKLTLAKNSIVGESTFLQYYNWEETEANAFVIIKWKYYKLPFSLLKEELDTNPNKDIILSYFKQLENNRKNKTEQIH